MKICQLCAVDFTLYHFLLPLMRSLRGAGHEVTGVCARGKLSQKVEAEGFRVLEAPIRRSSNPYALWRAYRALVRLFREERFDIVHVHTPVAALVGRLAAARAGVPKIVYTAHGFYFHSGMPWPKRVFHMALEWIGGRCTDLLFTQAAEDADTARALCLSRGPVHAIGNGSDPSRFRPASEDPATRARVRAELGTPQDRPAIAVVGRLVAEKGYPELFQAMRGIDAELWVIGERLDSDHAQPIRESIASVEADPATKAHVRFLGYRADVPDLLRAADIFTLPSHREGMPRSILEAMLAGLPVVATDIRGSREEVIDGLTGLLVPVRDPAALGTALAKLAADPALRAAMGKAGLERARELYDERKVVARQLEFMGLA
ncbi:MAG: glycosyltransferase family 4 protein [Proteobacteria bacterium]|nr:glycosyltransferase family 4 protein [Pseudomonadota bacterium]